MRKHALRLLAVSATYFALNSAFAANAFASTGTATGTTSTSDSGAPAAIPEIRIANRFEDMAGSPENAASLVAGLRSGTEITLSSPDGATGVSFTPATKPMGYGNITRALTLAQRQLAAQGITEPTPEQLHAALNGGTLTAVDSTGASRTVEMAGVLQLRSQGMGWGKIAHQLDVGPGKRAMTPTATATATRGTVDLRGSSRSHGAIVSGDGAIMHGRAPGASVPADRRGQTQARAQTQTQARAPVIQPGVASAHAGNTLVSIANRGNGPIHSQGNGRF